MVQCLLVEDQEKYRERIKAALKRCGFRVTPPSTKVDLDRIFASGAKFELVALDGCLWGNYSWLQAAPDIRRCLVPEARIICISADELTAGVMSRFFGFQVDYVGKDPEFLERFLMEPQLVY